MKKLIFTAVSRNYFNLPIWIAQHRGMFADEGLDVAIELYEGVDEVTNRLRDGRAQIGYGITEHVVLDSEAGGYLEIVGGNVNRLPFSLITGQEHQERRGSARQDRRRLLDRGRQLVAGDEAAGGARPATIRATTRCARSARSWRAGRCCNPARSMPDCRARR